VEFLPKKESGQNAFTEMLRRETAILNHPGNKIYMQTEENEKIIILTPWSAE
jgi:hypothetical protein